ncbi:MAG TPA: heme-binding beta-barrel domain-containing protein [Thermoanaerobaculia bacterium]|nr:heme-binding beta-barrel domain-containing protein [Thermoanaerobaculia bacterium]
MRTISARVSLLVLMMSGPAAAQDQPQPPPAPTPAAAAPAPATAGPAPAAAAAAPAWRPFQEFAFLVGSWSGSTESGARVGGRVARFTPELTENYLVHRGSTFLTADDGKEETIEEVGYFAYDREKRRYVASYFFSTGISATFDVEIAPEGLRLASRELLNAEAGTKARMLFSRKPDGELALSMDLAPGGKELVPFLTSSLRKK